MPSESISVTPAIPTGSQPVGSVTRPPASPEVSPFSRDAQPKEVQSSESVASSREDLEKAIEKNVLSSVDSAIKSLETAGMAIAKANKNNKESSAAAASFAMAISNFSALPVWQKRVVGLLVFLVFSWILILSAMNNDEKSEFEEIDQTMD